MGASSNSYTSPLVPVVYSVYASPLVPVVYSVYRVVISFRSIFDLEVRYKFRCTQFMVGISFSYLFTEQNQVLFFIYALLSVIKVDTGVYYNFSYQLIQFYLLILQIIVSIVRFNLCINFIFTIFEFTHRIPINFIHSFRNSNYIIKFRQILIINFYNQFRYYFHLLFRYLVSLGFCSNFIKSD